jgi:transcriptional regulator with XRE-family HTH domain
MAHRLDQMKTQRESAGHSLQTLAKKANVSELTIKMLENGGTVGVEASQRIADALGVSLATLGKADIT